MEKRIQFLIIFLSLNLSIYSQKNSDKILIRDLDSKSVEINFNGRIFNYDFIFPEVMSINSYFVSTKNNMFYVKYEYTGSATSKYFDLVGFTWKNGNLYVKEYVIMNNQKGKWKGIARIINDKLVNSYEEIENIITSFETQNEISIIRNSTKIGKIKIPKKIVTELIIDDKIFFEILNDARNYK